MARFIFAPEWFYGIDSFFELFSVIAALLVAISAFRIYKFSKNTTYRYFALAFLMLSVAFISKIITNILVYYGVLENHLYGSVNVLVSTISSLEFAYILGYLGYRFLFLMALLGIYMVTYKSTSKKDIFLFSYLIFITCVLTHYYFNIFHLTAIVILFPIVQFYFEGYIKKGNMNTLLIGISFLLLLISQALYFFVYLDFTFYVAAQILQLIGFTLLFIVMVKLR